MTLVFFNLLINATFSLLAGIAVVEAALWLFRIPNGSWKATLLLIPFAKVIFDFARGIPANSVLAAGIDPYVLPSKHQIFSIGGGLTNWGPQLNVILETTGLDGKNYASSVGDYLAIWIERKFGHGLPLLIVSIAASISGILILIRIFQAVRFEKRRLKDRAAAESLPRGHVLGRDVDFYTSCAFSGTPFTGGIFKPYICLPNDAKVQLNHDELEAVIGHELGHIIKFDLLITMVVQFIGDLFWFVPGYRWLSRKIDDLRELNADQWATEHGANPVFLASALIKLRELPDHADNLILYSAFFRRKSILKTRVETLIGERCESASRFGWNHRAIRLGVAILVLATVMLTTIGGNQTTQAYSNPEWFNSILRSMGLS